MGGLQVVDVTHMTQVAEIRKVVCHLSASDRAELAAFLLSTLDETHYSVSDEEVHGRQDELNSGQVKGLSVEEFKVACGRYDGDGTHGSSWSGE